MSKVSWDRGAAEEVSVSTGVLILLSVTILGGKPDRKNCNHFYYPTNIEQPGFDFLGPLRSSPAVLGGALPHSRFSPPSLGSRKTRSEPAPLGGACSVASRFSSLVGSSSATPASAAAAAAPLGSQILQRRPRAFPLPRYTPAPLRPGPLAFRGPRCAERAPRPERPSTRPPPPPQPPALPRGQAGPGSVAPAGGGRGGGQPGAAPAGRGGVGGPAPGRWCGMPPPPPPGCVRSPRLVPVSGGWPGAGLAPQPPLQG
ncbi:translation initiation factor IF-2-like [Ursus arctos]|uniref:translation initiation factor IF-2-like n=1 Tax=Ursus arctos TaxID=9644 RepID=UPI0025482B75|nr:translation initiation factor IF-2-like [Ursus arctos]